MHPSPPPELISYFVATSGKSPEFAVRAPGRVNLIGGHVDHSGGLVLPAAISRNVWVAARRRPDRYVVIRSLNMGAEAGFDLATLDISHKTGIPTWAWYAAGVAWAMTQAGIDLPGCDLVVTGDVPMGAGLSSSAAVEVAYALGWAHMTGWQGDLMGLAQLCLRAERDYVGVNCGLMDQFASLFGRADHALLLDCRSLEWEAVPLGNRVTLVVADTGTRRTLTNSHFNDRRAELEQALRVLQTMLPGIHMLRDVSVEQFHACKDAIPQPARNRARHVIEEIARVEQAVAALRSGDMATLGHLMDQSLISSRDLYDSSGPELNAMWEASKGHPARLGGRFLGAGWAGCLLFLVDAEGSEDFAAYTARRYAERTDHLPDLFAVKAAQGAQVIPFAEGS